MQFKSKIMSCYNSIVKNEQNYTKLPSFVEKGINLVQSLDFGRGGEKYVLEFTDTNNVPVNYSFSVRDNKLTVTASNAPSDSVKITTRLSKCPSAQRASATVKPSQPTQTEKFKSTTSRPAPTRLPGDVR